MGYGKTRPMSHIKGEQGVKILKEIFPASWVVREYSPDYGIDLDVEIFEEHNGHFRTTGEHIYFQVKATESPNFDTIKITPRFNVEKDYKYFSGEIKTIKVIKFIIDTDLLFTVEKMGSAVPVILSVVDLTTKNAYFICLNDYIEKIIVPENSDYELMVRECAVDIGIVYSNERNAKGKLTPVAREIDFIAASGGKKTYIQSAYALGTEEKSVTENKPLSLTGDSFPKIIVRHDIRKRWYDDNGVLNIGVLDFLLDDTLV